MKNLVTLLICNLFCFSLANSQAIEILSLISKDSILISARQDSFFGTTRFDTAYLGYEALRLNVQSIEHISDVYLDIAELGDSTAFFLTNITYRDSFIIWMGKSYVDGTNGYLTLIQYKQFISGYIY